MLVGCLFGSQGKRNRMGYKTGRIGIVRVKPLLDRLIEAKEERESVLFSVQDPAEAEKLAYKLREAIATAYRLPEFKDYHTQLHGIFAFKATKKGVYARLKVLPVIVVGTLEGETKPGEGFTVDPVRRARDRSTKGTIPEAVTLEDVLLGAMKGSEEGMLSLYFKNVILNDERKEKLWAWTQGLDVEWLYVDHGDRGLTLTKEEIKEEILWKPKPDEKKELE